MSFMQEAMRGYAFLNQIDRQQKNDDLMMQQHKREQDRHVQQTALNEQQQQINSQNLKTNQSKLDAQSVNLMHHKAKAHGVNHEFSVDDLVQLHQNQMIDVPRFLSDDYRANFDIMENVIQGNLNKNSPAALAAANDMLSAVVKKGIGQQGKNGKTIVDKRIVGIFPSEDGQNLMFDLEVELEDGTIYNAPVTEKRGTESDNDNLVRQVPVQNIMKHLMGQSLLSQAIDQSGIRQELQGAFNSVKSQFEPKKTGTRLYKPDNLPLESANAAVKLYKDQDVGLGGVERPLEYFQAKTNQAYGLPYDKKIVKKYDELEQYPIADQVVTEAMDQLDSWVPNIGGLDKPDFNALMQKAKIIASKQGIDLSDKILKTIVQDKLGITDQNASLESDPQLNSNLRKQKPDAVRNLLDDHLSDNERKAQSQLFDVEM